ncbi:MAG: hypothetical protein JOZ87_32515 [Chloroflexi bacterium]|nr:hypothetical protein [Chloroflexota bacterium]
MAGLVAALICAELMWALSDGNAALTAAMAAWAETAGYYGVMLALDLRQRAASLQVVARDLVLEFGAAEALDSLVVRPIVMFEATQLLPEPMLAVLATKLVADVIFYLPTIASLQLRRRYLPN